MINIIDFVMIPLDAVLLLSGLLLLRPYIKAIRWEQAKRKSFLKKQAREKEAFKKYGFK